MAIRNGLVFTVFLLSAMPGASAQAPKSAQKAPAPETPSAPAPETPSAPTPKPPSDNKNPSTPSAMPIQSVVTKPIGQGTSATVLDISAIQGLMGRSVRSYAGDDMGQIVDCLVTPAGQARAVVIDFGGVLGVGSRKVAVDWKALDFSGAAKGGPVVLALTRNEVRVSPEYKAGDPVVVLEAGNPEGPKTAPLAPVPLHPAQGTPVAPPADSKKN